MTNYEIRFPAKFLSKFKVLLGYRAELDLRISEAAEKERERKREVER